MPEHEPRPPLPRGVRIALVFGGWTQIAWLTTALFAWAAAFQIDEMHFDFLTFADPTAVASGDLLGIERHEEPQSRGRKPWVYFEHSYRFQVDGLNYWGESFADERIPGKEPRIEYVVAEPERSRIVDMRTRPRSGWNAVGGMAAFLAMALVAWSRHLRVHRIADSARVQLTLRPHRSHWRVGTGLRLGRSGELIARVAWRNLVPPVLGIAGFVFLYARMP
ncbi:MAG: hypothetical protein H6835_17560 [Planctomycetes bacterium]|nr:hypothetical protein [Planctomycetota bacterium]